MVAAPCCSGRQQPFCPKGVGKETTYRSPSTPLFQLQGSELYVIAALFRAGGIQTAFLLTIGGCAGRKKGNQRSIQHSTNHFVGHNYKSMPSALHPPPRSSGLRRGKRGGEDVGAETKCLSNAHYLVTRRCPCAIFKHRFSFFLERF